MKSRGSWWVGEHDESVESEGEVEAAEIEVSSSWRFVGMKEMDLRGFEDRKRGGWFPI